MKNRVSNYPKMMVAAIIALVISWVAVGFAPGIAQASTDNLAAAQAKYKVSDENVVTVTDVADLVSELNYAGGDATADNKIIVYLPSGNYTLTATATIPENVVLVGEKDTKVTAKTTFGNNVMVQMHGSVYGGYYDGNKKNQTVLKFLEASFANDNGRIDNATVINANYYGIVAKGKGCKNAVVNGVTVTKSTASGISVMDGAYVKTISNSSFNNNGKNKEGAGINLSHADVGTIQKCTIKNNADKAVSTNSDPVSTFTSGQPGCTIGSITGCTISGNKVNGVYIKPKCTLKNFTKNTLSGNNDGLSAVAATPAGTKGKSVIKNVANNTFKGSKMAQIKAKGKGAVVTIKGNNKITGGKAAGILAEDGGVINVTGSKNQITSNKGAGLNAQSSGKITVKGSGNIIKKNKNMAVYCVTKGSVILEKAKISGKIYVKKGTVKNDGKKIVKPVVL